MTICNKEAPAESSVTAQYRSLGGFVSGRTGLRGGSFALILWNITTLSWLRQSRMRRGVQSRGSAPGPSARIDAPILALRLPQPSFLPCFKGSCPIPAVFLRSLRTCNCRCPQLESRTGSPAELAKKRGSQSSLGP